MTARLNHPNGGALPAVALQQAPADPESSMAHEYAQACNHALPHVLFQVIASYAAHDPTLVLEVNANAATDAWNREVVWSGAGAAIGSPGAFYYTATLPPLPSLSTPELVWNWSGRPSDPPYFPSRTLHVLTCRADREGEAPAHWTLTWPAAHPLKDTNGGGLSAAATTKGVWSARRPLTLPPGHVGARAYMLGGRLVVIWRLIVGGARVPLRARAYDAAADTWVEDDDTRAIENVPGDGFEFAAAGSVLCVFGRGVCYALDLTEGRQALHPHTDRIWRCAHSWSPTVNTAPGRFIPADGSRILSLNVDPTSCQATCYTIAEQLALQLSMWEMPAAVKALLDTHTPHLSSYWVDAFSQRVHVLFRMCKVGADAIEYVIASHSIREDEKSPPPAGGGSSGLPCSDRLSACDSDAWTAGASATANQTTKCYGIVSMAPPQSCQYNIAGWKVVSTKNQAYKNRKFV